MHRSFTLCWLAVLVFAVACEPTWMFSGGELSGDVATTLPDDWSFSDDVKEVQLETRPDDPYSVNIWGVSQGDRFWVAAGRGAESSWAQNMIAEPNVRLRISDTLYELRAVRVDDEDSRARVLVAMKQKYDFEPDAEDAASAWLFRLDPR